ncbi:hypothetical protein CEXT_288421 [Caerostris extrusa]|uniref:Secreted protein n=1 Tax=Caerostris extrusa TaxID=172846 RepID=A0AAV4P1Z4_CAEEX|nr:hypothetical protein CEXT_288421 [Caerostris extrusa]
MALCQFFLSSLKQNSSSNIFGALLLGLLSSVAKPLIVEETTLSPSRVLSQRSAKKIQDARGRDGIRQGFLGRWNSRCHFQDSGRPHRESEIAAPSTTCVQTDRRRQAVQR